MAEERVVIGHVDSNCSNLGLALASMPASDLVVASLGGMERELVEDFPIPRPRLFWWPSNAGCSAEHASSIEESKVHVR